MPREIRPVNARRIGYDPDPHGEVPPPVHEQIATLAEAQETALSTPANAPARQVALTRVRALLARIGVGASVPVAEGGLGAGSALTEALPDDGAQ